jgi:hypothetical protein
MLLNKEQIKNRNHTKAGTALISQYHPVVSAVVGCSRSQEHLHGGIQLERFDQSNINKDWNDA